MENFEKIEKLVKSKSYDSLTDTEKILVQDFTKEEYDSFRLTVLNVSSGFSYEKPNSKIKENLLQEFHAVHAPVHEKEKKGWWAFLFPEGTSFIMKPGLQIGFASLVIILGAWFFSTMNFNNSENLAQNNIDLKEESKIETIKKENLEVEEVSDLDHLTAINKEQVFKHEVSDDSDKKISLESKNKNLEFVKNDVDSYSESAPDMEIVDEKVKVESSEDILMTGMAKGKDLKSSKDMSVSVAEEVGLLDLLSATY